MAEEFSAAPKVVKPKNKYKQQPEEQEEDQIKLIYNNLMWDKRVFRGNTYSAIVISKKTDGGYDTKAQLPIIPRKKQMETTNTFDNNKRANIEIFSDQFVESLTDKPPRYQYASQTQPLPQNSIVRHRMEQKIGTDRQTQIWDTQLFDFDYESQPLLNVLCGRTLQISRMEVLQEEELRIMSNRQQELRLYEREENKKIQNMYEAQDKLQQENLKRIDKFKKDKDKKIKTHQRVFSRVLSKQYLRDIKKNTMNYVQGNGFFRNILDYRFSSELLPKMYVETLSIAQEDTKLNNQAQSFLEAAKQSILKDHAFAKEVQKTRRKAILAKREQVARQKNERKMMAAAQKVMRKFLVEEKAYLQQQAKKAEENVEEPQEQP